MVPTSGSDPDWVDDRRRCHRGWPGRPGDVPPLDSTRHRARGLGSRRDRARVADATLAIVPAGQPQSVEPLARRRVPGTGSGRVPHDRRGRRVPRGVRDLIRCTGRTGAHGTGSPRPTERTIQPGAPCRIVRGSSRGGRHRRLRTYLDLAAGKLTATVPDPDPQRRLLVTGLAAARWRPRRWSGPIRLPDRGRARPRRP